MSQNLDQLMLRILVFVDRNGSIVEKFSTPMSSTLKMKYKEKNWDITMHAFAHGMGNGSSGVKVKFNGKLVFEAGGSFRTEPYNVKATTYLPGDWESKFPEV